MNPSTTSKKLKTPGPQECTCRQPLTAICPYHDYLGSIEGAVEGGSPTDPRTPSYLVLQLLTQGAQPVAYVLGASGATVGVIATLAKRNLVVRWREGEREMVRLSAAGIAVAESTAQAYSAIRAAK